MHRLFPSLGVPAQPQFSAQAAVLAGALHQRDGLFRSGYLLSAVGHRAELRHRQVRPERVLAAQVQEARRARAGRFADTVGQGGLDCAVLSVRSVRHRLLYKAALLPVVHLGHHRDIPALSALLALLLTQPREASLHGAVRRGVVSVLYTAGRSAQAHRLPIHKPGAVICARRSSRLAAAERRAEAEPPRGQYRRGRFRCSGAYPRRAVYLRRDRVFPAALQQHLSRRAYRFRLHRSALRAGRTA